MFDSEKLQNKLHISGNSHISILQHSLHPTTLANSACLQGEIDESSERMSCGEGNCVCNSRIPIGEWMRVQAAQVSITTFQPGQMFSEGHVTVQAVQYTLLCLLLLFPQFLLIKTFGFACTQVSAFWGSTSVKMLSQKCLIFPNLWHLLY